MSSHPITKDRIQLLENTINDNLGNKQKIPNINTTELEAIFSQLQ